MEERTTYVGLDVHKKMINVALLRPGTREPVTWDVPNEPEAIRRFTRKLARLTDGPVACCYEAGPCGYVLQRQLRRRQVACQVIAPSLIPRKPGARLKTNRRDARKLAELHRAGLLTEVAPPAEAEEAVRDLCRACTAAQRDLLRCRHRLSTFLLRRGLRYTAGRSAWTHTHRRWLRQLPVGHATDRVVFDDALLAIEQLEARVGELDVRVAALAAQAPYRTPVGWLRCFRGIDTLTALIVVAELFDIRRFPRARGLMGFLGMIPSEDSSGDTVRHGRITKMGNRHLRRVLIEAAWHYRHRAAVGPTLRRRRAGQPARVIALADQAQQRLCRRFTVLSFHRKPAPNVAVAVARELAGFLWAVLHEGPEPAPVRGTR